MTDRETLKRYLQQALQDRGSRADFDPWSGSGDRWARTQGPGDSRSRRAEDGSFPPLPWDYRKKLLDFLKPDTTFLDMETGDGGLLLSLNHPYPLTAVTRQGEKPHRSEERWFKSLGISVHPARGGKELPFPEDCFQVVSNYQGSYDLKELFRVLRPGGFFVTQQLGGQNDRSLIRRLLPGCSRGRPDFNLENQRPLFEGAGFRVMYRNQAYGKAQFSNVRAVCRYAAAHPRRFPGFSVEACLDSLMDLVREMGQTGVVETERHHWILIGKKERR